MPSKQVEELLRRAQELAVSGTCRDYLHIADTLVVEGFANARTILDNPITRAELNKACNAHWKGER